MLRNDTRNFTRIQFREPLSQAWERAAAAGNATSEFKPFSSQTLYVVSTILQILLPPSDIFPDQFDISYGVQPWTSHCRSDSPTPVLG
jgi:hypothetical protein